MEDGDVGHGGGGTKVREEEVCSLILGLIRAYPYNPDDCNENNKNPSNLDAI